MEYLNNSNIINSNNNFSIEYNDLQGNSNRSNGLPTSSIKATLLANRMKALTDNEIEVVNKSLNFEDNNNEVIIEK